MGRYPLLSAVLLFMAPVLLATPEGIPIQYMDPRGRLPMTTAERLVLREERGPYGRTVAFAAAGSSDEKVVLLVEEAIGGDIAASLATYQSDLENEGYLVETWMISGGTAEDIRADLQAEYAGGSLVGAVCIGDIPTGWMDTGFGEYPVDLFLMDMDGTWTDSNGDGLYESYSNAEPEIWVGRLTPTFLTFGGPAELLNDYFARNHAYRTGSLTLPDRALAYEEAFTGLTGYLHDLYPVVVTKNDPAGTNADDFKAELLGGYEWVHLISHSSPWGSSFHDGAPPSGGGTLVSLEVPPLDPNAFFYVLNCCSNGRWTEVDNLANSYIWSDSYGLAALAQTKVDYTNYFKEYYQTLATGSCLGEAYRNWLANSMYYEHAAVLLGDPTLRPRLGALRCASLAGGGGSPSGTDTWLAFDLTDGLHTQGRVDTYYDPSSERVFAVCGTSDPVRANILSTHTDGDTWAAPIPVCDHTYWDWHPTVGGDGEGNVWTAWQSMQNNMEGYDIYVSRWDGSSWVEETILTEGDPFEVEPSLDGGGGRAWLVWQKWENTSTCIEGVFWTGSAWSSIVSISSGGAERHPDVARGGDGFGLVYHARREGDWAVCFRDAPDSGPFGEETVISSTGENGRFASITSDGSQYWAAWQNDEGVIMSSRGSGASWSAPEAVSTPGGCVRPSISASPSGEVTVMWTRGMNELACNTCIDGVWQGPATAVTDDAVDNASLAWDGEKLWAVYGRRGTDLQWDLWACTPDPVGIAAPERPGAAALSLSVAGANPFSGSTVLSIDGPSGTRLRIYDMSGRSVLDTAVETGLFTWAGTDAAGTEVPSGVYFAVVSADGAMESRRLVRL